MKPFNCNTKSKDKLMFSSLQVKNGSFLMWVLISFFLFLFPLEWKTRNDEPSLFLPFSTLENPFPYNKDSPSAICTPLVLRDMCVCMYSQTRGLAMATAGSRLKEEDIDLARLCPSSDLNMKQFVRTTFLSVKKFTNV